MLRKFNDLFRQARTAEHGNGMLVLFLMMFVLLMAFFGLAVDTSRAVHARTQAQSTLDSAVVAAATQLNTNKNVINTSQARSLAEEFYGSNRKNIGGIGCASAADVTAAKKDKNPSAVRKGPAGCKFVRTSSSKPSNNQFRMSVRECVPTTFLSIITEEFCFNIHSTSRTAQNVG